MKIVSKDDDNGWIKLSIKDVLVQEGQFNYLRILLQMNSVTRCGNFWKFLQQTF